MDPQLQATLHRLESLQLQRQETLDQYKSILEQRSCVSRYLGYAQKWNVTNDCFHIWHHGPFGTINGLRLGAEAPPLPVVDDGMAKVGSLSSSPSSPNGAAAAAAIKSTEPPRRYLLFSSPAATTVNTSATETHTGTSKPEVPLKIPWIEINSALGQVALLLHVLEQKPHSGISYGHEIQPMGSTSKIGMRRGEATSAVTTYYNLCSDDSFSLFGKRNFNIALQTLLECISTAAHAIQERDRTIAIPHAIQPPHAQQQHHQFRANNNASAEWTIGGLSIHYGLDGVEWTRAMKYLLTNVKWLVAYSSKHVDL